MARPRSDIAPRIVEAARARFLADGVDGASLRAIAREAGTSIGMVYYYYPTKDDLFLAVIEETYGKLLDDLARALAPDAPVDVRLTRMFERFGVLTDGEVATVRMLAREALASSNRLDRLMQRFLVGHVPLIFSAVTEGVASGILAPRHPAVMLVACMAVGIAPQVIRRMVGQPLGPLAALPEGKELSRDLADILLHGLSVPSPTTR